jgi:hypothetical protein
MSAPISRKQLSAAGLLNKARRFFAKIPDPCDGKITLVDYLMSGLALFGLKYPSLLQFEHDSREETTRANLHALYGIERAPSDTRFRERPKRHPLSRTSRCIRSEPVAPAVQGAVCRPAARQGAGGV